MFKILTVNLLKIKYNRTVINQILLQKIMYKS
jgi:hypothetical protein